MKVYILPIFFIFMTASVSGQQFLWSTIEKDTISEKQIPVAYVTNEILKFYDHYKNHYDLSGFSKERFIEEIDYGFSDLNWINDISELEVFAFRSNIDSGSVVLVMFISDKNVNLIIFSNHVLDSNFNYLKNYDFKRKKFETWLKTLMK